MLGYFVRVSRASFILLLVHTSQLQHIVNLENIIVFAIESHSDSFAPYTYVRPRTVKHHSRTGIITMAKHDTVNTISDEESLLTAPKKIRKSPYATSAAAELASIFASMADAADARPGGAATAALLTPPHFLPQIKILHKFLRHPHNATVYTTLPSRNEAPS